MNKMIIKLGLLLALTLPAGAMELPEAPEVPGRANVLGLSAEDIDHKVEEISNVLTSLKSAARTPLSSTENTQRQVQSDAKGGMPVIYDQTTGFNTDVLVNRMRKLLEEIIEANLQRSKEYVDKTVRKIVTIVTADRNCPPKVLNNIAKHIAKYNSLDESKRSDYVKNLKSKVKGSQDIIKDYDMVIAINPEFRGQINSLNENDKKLKMYQEETNGMTEFDGDIKKAYRLLNEFFGGGITIDKSGNSDASERSKETVKTKRLFDFIENLENCMPRIEMSVKKPKMDMLVNLKDNVDIGKFLAQHKRFMKKLFGLSTDTLDIPNDGKSFTFVLKHSPAQDICADVFNDLFTRPWRESIETFKINDWALNYSEGIIHEWFTKLPNIKVFEVASNFGREDLSRKIDAELAKGVSQAKNLVSFTVKNYKDKQAQPAASRFSGQMFCLELTLKALSEVPSLQYVDLSNNYNTGLNSLQVNILIKLGSCQNVRGLNLRGNNIKEKDKEKLMEEIREANPNIELILDD